jgi:hypothetical protein
VKYCEIIADNLSKAGLSWDCVSAIDSSGRTVWIVDAHGYGKRFIVRTEEILTAFFGTGKCDTCVRGEFIVVTDAKNSEPVKKYILSLLGIFVAMTFIASCQQEGTTVTEEPSNGPTVYLNRPAPSPTR